VEDKKEETRWNPHLPNLTKFGHTQVEENTRHIDLYVVQNSLKLNSTRLVKLNHMLFKRRAASTGGKCTIAKVNSWEVEDKP